YIAAVSKNICHDAEICPIKVKSPKVIGKCQIRRPPYDHKVLIQTHRFGWKLANFLVFSVWIRYAQKQLRRSIGTSIATCRPIWIQRGQVGKSRIELCPPVFDQANVLVAKNNEFAMGNVEK